MKLHKVKIPDIVLLPICLFRCELISVYTIYSRLTGEMYYKPNCDSRENYSINRCLYRVEVPVCIFIRTV